MRNIPITVLTFLIVISFFVIVVVPYHIDNDNRMKDSTAILQVLRGGSAKPKNFDKNFHRILQKGFPDWEGRMEYEKKQRDIYNSAQNKLKISPLELSSSKEFFSAEEKDAIAYFEGTGFYQYYQKIEKRPNIYDTRETFLLKMHDQYARDKFLNSLQLKSKLSDKN